MRVFRSILAFAAALAAAAPAAAATLVGGTTSVTLTSAPTLIDLGLNIAPVGTATIVTNDDGTPVARFPITAAQTGTGGNAVIFHNGSGLAFSAGDDLLEIGDFVVSTADRNITGFARANGSILGFVPLFRLDDELNLFLTAEAAGAFTTVFGAPDLTGTLIGAAAIAPVPEPESWALMIGGFLIVGAVTRRRQQLALPA